MGKQRDKIIWQLGKKSANQEAYREYLMRRAIENNLPTRMKKLATSFR